MKTALTIAGSDPTGGAGLQADLKVFRAFGVHGLAVVSAVTAQNTLGVESVLPIEKEFFEKQLHILLSDTKPEAVKLGMLYSTWAVELITSVIKEYSLKNLVIDPVTVSSSGRTLVADGTLDAVREKLFPLSKVITPNIYEASVLTGAARILKNMGPEVVVITGGHLEEIALDLYYDGEFHDIEGKKIEGQYHGTGCAFSAAITASLAIGHISLESVRHAKEFINTAIRKAYHPGKGMGLLYL
jgi:hydroxymethylpyrimidine/phosphomethylpyrimidine kinase